jgi:IS30 family transposase
MTYHQITAAERYALLVLQGQGRCPAAIARALGRHRSTITRELARNGTRHDGYGLIRQYLPKRTSMEQLTQCECTRIAMMLNR